MNDFFKQQLISKAIVNNLDFTNPDMDYMAYLNDVDEQYTNSLIPRWLDIRGVFYHEMDDDVTWTFIFSPYIETNSITDENEEELKEIIKEEFERIFPLDIDASTISPIIKTINRVWVIMVPATK